MFTKKKEGMYKRAKIFKECMYPNISETAFQLLFFSTVISKKYKLPLENEERKYFHHFNFLLCLLVRDWHILDNY